eukprot:5040968-Lingulodinium_polyedra.AAC.1
MTPATRSLSSGTHNFVELSFVVTPLAQVHMPGRHQASDEVCAAVSPLLPQQHSHAIVGACVRRPAQPTEENTH